MTQLNSTPVARVRDLHDLLGVIPHLLGFHPEESLVLLIVLDGRVELTARADLTDLRPPGHLELLVDRLLLRWPAAGVWLVGYAQREVDGWQLLERARTHLGEALSGDPICVTGARYRLGSPDGPEFVHDPASTPSAAAATFHGLQARGSRAELAQGLRADPARAGVSEAAWVDARERLESVGRDALPDELIRQIATALMDPAGVDDADLAWLGLLAHDPNARDAAVLSLERDFAEGWVDLWIRVVRACPFGTQHQPLAILALAAWVGGNGALASVCLEELESQGARPGLKAMLEELNEAIVPPSQWDSLRRELLASLEDSQQHC